MRLFEIATKKKKKILQWIELTQKKVLGLHEVHPQSIESSGLSEIFANINATVSTVSTDLRKFFRKFFIRRKTSPFSFIFQFLCFGTFIF